MSIDGVSQSKLTSLANKLLEQDEDKVITKEEIRRLKLINPNADHIDGVFPSKTIIRMIDVFDASIPASLIEVELLTGRTHQIRVHMSYIGHPLIGDWLYGETSDLLPRQALHAASFSIIHPIKKEPLTFEAPIPDDFKKLVSSLKNHL